MSIYSELDSIAGEIISSYEKVGGINRIDRENLPSRDHVDRILDGLFILLFPGYFGRSEVDEENIRLFTGNMINSVYLNLKQVISQALITKLNGDRKSQKEVSSQAEQESVKLLKKIPEIRIFLKNDVKAAYDGDPAAKNLDEIISCYPFIEAVTTHRIAHELYKEDIPLIPRMMAEKSHSKTGIDIHPGAILGNNFFIDHGTGVVIGETAEIGNNVKIYQGVTIGALSFPKDGSGKILKGGKRHPTIEDNVVIYSGATILGGETIIGSNSIIGANTWVIDSVPPNTKVTIAVNQAVKDRNNRDTTKMPAMYYI